MPSPDTQPLGSTRSTNSWRSESERRSAAHAAWSAKPAFISYSVNCEDVILQRIFGTRSPGFYIDVGAGHPTFGNDTKALYEQGWRGINIEPNPRFFAALVEDRTGDQNICVALGSTEGEVTYYDVLDTDLSTCSATDAQCAQARGFKIAERKIPITTLAHVLDQTMPSSVQLLKVGVAGFEEQVLVGNNWQKYRPEIIIIEATYPESPQRRPTTIGPYLKSLGYHWRHFDGLNDFYAREDLSFPEQTFGPPPNIFDRFKLRAIADLEATIERTQARLLGELQNEKAKSARLEIDLQNVRFEHGVASAACMRMRESLVKFNQRLQSSDLLEEELDRARSRVDQLSQAIAELQTHLHQARTECLRFRTSTSWRITAPVRALKRSLSFLSRRSGSDT